MGDGRTVWGKQAYRVGRVTPACRAGVPGPTRAAPSWPAGDTRRDVTDHGISRPPRQHSPEFRRCYATSRRSSQRAAAMSSRPARRRTLSAGQLSAPYISVRGRRRRSIGRIANIGRDAPFMRMPDFGGRTIQSDRDRNPNRRPARTASPNRGAMVELPTSRTHAQRPRAVGLIACSGIRAAAAAGKRRT